MNDENKGAEHNVCVKCIICNLGAISPLQEMAALLPVVRLKGKASEEVIGLLAKAEEAAKAARDCLLGHLGVDYAAMYGPSPDIGREA